MFFDFWISNPLGKFLSAFMLPPSEGNWKKKTLLTKESWLKIKVISLSSCSDGSEELVTSPCILVVSIKEKIKIPLRFDCDVITCLCHGIGILYCLLQRCKAIHSMLCNGVVYLEPRAPRAWSEKRLVLFPFQSKFHKLSVKLLQEVSGLFRIQCRDCRSISC